MDDTNKRMERILIKNIFLTGKVQVGKSTIINKIPVDYSASVSGFKTLRYYEQGELSGFYFNPLLKELVPEEPAFIARRMENDCWTAYPSVFDTLGTSVLNECLMRKPSLCVMDELGFFENSAIQFQRKVLTI